MFRFHRHHLVKPALMLLLGAAFAGAQEVHRLSPASLAGLPRSTAQVQVHGAKEQALYEGVALGDLVRKLGAPVGEAIRGAKLSLVVVVKAADGYQAVFALPELDPLFTKKVVLLADRRDGSALAAKEGPYRLVVPDEARQARWVRQVVSIELKPVD
jgi:Oxidoreductase molybdopterin binding domain